jgi:putative hydrolase of the HAD superfamily
VPAITHLLLDLDDTLYPSTSGVWEAVRSRIHTYMEQQLAISPAEASALRERYLDQFGTTLSGLKVEFGVDIEDYLDYVHDVPLDQFIWPDPALGAMLKSIQVPRIIFTNAYRPHAERVMDRLAIRQEIDQVIDIYALQFHNKPKVEAYQLALELISAKDPGGVIFADDRLANLEPAAEMGITTVLVGSKQAHNSHLHVQQIAELTNILPELCKQSPGAVHAR